MHVRCFKFKLFVKASFDFGIDLQNYYKYVFISQQEEMHQELGMYADEDFESLSKEVRNCKLPH